MPCCILVRDYRLPIGGVETWVETLGQSLPRLGVRTIVLVPREGQSAETRAKMDFPDAEVYLVTSVEDAVGQAKVILAAVFGLKLQRAVFFTGYYIYNDIVGINLLGSMIAAVPVMHGRSESSFPWISAGPPEAIISPSFDFAEQCEHNLRKNVGILRSRSRVHVIPHGVGLPHSEAVEVKLKRLMLRPLRVSAVSRLNNDLKRPWDYIAIAKGIQERGLPIQILLAGNGPEFSSMKSFCENHHFGTYLQLRGMLSSLEVASQNLACDCFLSTSESEAFGLSAFEAAGAGCAVITASIPGPVSNLVSRGAALAVPVGDIPGFVSALERVVHEESLVREMGRRGSQYVRQEFSVELMAQRYADLIHRLCAQRFWVFSRARFVDEFVDSPEQRARVLAVSSSRFRRVASKLLRRVKLW